MRLAKTQAGGMRRAPFVLFTFRREPRLRTVIVSSCSELNRMTTVPPMRSFLGKVAGFSSAVLIGCFGSCERHRATELPAEQEHAKSAAPDAHDRGSHAGPPGHGTPAIGHEHPQDHAAPPAAASPVGTPAQFFPPTSPSPR